MKYLGKKFSSPANSKEFVDNWDEIFKKDEPESAEPKPKEPDPWFKTEGVDGVPFDI